MRLALLACALLAGTALVPARAQMETREGIALQNQILELQHEMQTLQAQRGGGGYAPPAPSRGGGSVPNDITAQLLDRVSTLEDQVRTLRGQVDELNNRMQRTADGLNKQISDLNFRLQNTSSAPSAPAAAPSLAAPAASAPGGSSPLQAPAGTAPARRPPELAMQEGNAALARRDYAPAESAAREVLATGRGPRTTDADFLLAQALAGKRDYQGAAIAYDDAYNKARSAPRGADALLGLSNALLSLGDRQAACASLDKLRAEYPSARPEVREGAVAVRGRAACH